MFRITLYGAALAVAISTPALAQNTNSSTTQSTTRPRTSAQQTTTPPAATPKSSPATTTGAATTQTAGQKRAQSPAEVAQTRAVREAFDTLVDGIRRADAKAVMGVYWNSPQLVLFNNNGTVTKSWDQVRQNRESLYSKVQDVKLDVRDVNVRLLGPTAAVVTTVWEQTQNADGQSERATGRLTLVFQKVGGAWKAVHAHTSPDRPDPSRLLPSERTTTTPASEPPVERP